MTLQQMRYVDAIARSGSISEAARRCFVTQPTLTEAIKTLEAELKTSIFTRTQRGAVLTREGTELLASIRQILADVALIQAKYSAQSAYLPEFSVTSQHYAFAARAFIDTVREMGGDICNFSMRETVTSEVFRDVSQRRSEIGIAYKSKRNGHILDGIMKREGLVFAPLFVSAPHVCLAQSHPLAGMASIKPEQLEKYPFISFDQGGDNALYYSEEVMPSIECKRCIRVCDRVTMGEMIAGLGGYTICSVAIKAEAEKKGFALVPFEYDDEMRVGIVTKEECAPSKAGRIFARELVRRLGECVPAEAILAAPEDFMAAEES